MNDAANVLIIILSIVLVIFLITSIVLVVYLIQVARKIKKVSQDAAEVTHSAKNLVGNIASIISPVFFKSLANNIAKRVKSYFGGDDKKESKKERKK